MEKNPNISFSNYELILKKIGISEDESLILYRLLYDNSRDIILFLRYPEGTIIEANNAAIKAYGYERAELLSLTVFDLRAPETHSLITTQMEEADLSGIVFETIHRRSCGTVFPVEVSFTGTTIGKERVVLSIVRDISKRKKAEEDLEKAREEFISTLIHDLKSPLASIMASLILISDPDIGQIPRKKLEYINMTRHSCEILLTMVNNLVNVSMIEVGKMSYNFTSFNVSSFIQELSRTFASMAILNNITLDFRYPEDLWIYADRLKLRDVFFNLISNAFRHTPFGGRITINVSSHGETADICITDTGVGIPEHEQKRIFHKYTQAKGEHRGTGLGLYIVKSIVEAHGSSITVESEEGKGTSFMFTLKKGTMTDSDLPPRIPVILVGPKENGIYMIIKDLIQAQCSVEHVSKNKQALTRIFTSSPSLIIIYKIIPDAEIMSFLENLNSHHEAFRIPVIVISADKLQEWENRVTAHIPIPINLDTLNKLIADITSGAPAIR
ncbi:MAG: ATP-binding protein [Vulcanimicrobiota bacterium]